LREGEAIRGMALQMAKINFLNDKEEDGFVKALRGERPDLAGLPFLMGDACRTTGEHSRRLAAAVGLARGCRSLLSAPREDRDSLEEQRAAAAFWSQYQSACGVDDGRLAEPDREQATPVRIAALMQILAPESTALRVSLAERLAKTTHPEASRAIAKLAIFSPEEKVRQAALDALDKRRDREALPVLLSGLRYPWPAVAGRAAEAIVQLKRTDLLPQLIEALEEPDPRAPALKDVDGKKVPVVRELVKVNHHRSCLLCHAPGNDGKESRVDLRGLIPIPGEKFQLQYYPPRSAEQTVRADVTYLRQDFSVYQEVKDAAPWPKMQRYDFLVRERVLTADEAAAYRKALADSERGQPSPYQRAALSALRGLTGKDVGPDPDAWRQFLPPLKLEAEAPPS
jgi:hypothetical protein